MTRQRGETTLTIAKIKFYVVWTLAGPRVSGPLCGSKGQNSEERRIDEPLAAIVPIRPYLQIWNLATSAIFDSTDSQTAILLKLLPLRFKVSDVLHFFSFAVQVFRLSASSPLFWPHRVFRLVMNIPCCKGREREEKRECLGSKHHAQVYNF